MSNGNIQRTPPGLPRQKIEFGKDSGILLSTGAEGKTREVETAKGKEVLGRVSKLESTNWERVCGFFGSAADSSKAKLRDLNSYLGEFGMKPSRDLEKKILKGQLTGKDLSRLEEHVKAELVEVEQKAEHFAQDLKDKPVAKFTASLRENPIFKGKPDQSPVSEQFLQSFKTRIYVDGNISKSVVEDADPRKFRFYFDGKLETVVVNTVKDLDRLDILLQKCAQVSKSGSLDKRERSSINLADSLGVQEVFDRIGNLNENNDQRSWWDKLLGRGSEQVKKSSEFIKDEFRKLNAEVPEQIEAKLKEGLYLDNREIDILKSNIALAFNKQIFKKELRNVDRPVAKFTGSLAESFSAIPTDDELHQLKLELGKWGIPSIVASRSNPREFLVRDGNVFRVLTINKRDDLNTLQVFLQKYSSEAKIKRAEIAQKNTAPAVAGTVNLGAVGAKTVVATPASVAVPTAAEEPTPSLPLISTQPAPKPQAAAQQPTGGLPPTPTGGPPPPPLGGPPPGGAPKPLSQKAAAKPQATPPSSTKPQSGDLLQQIRGGTKLKSVNVEAEKAKKVEEPKDDQVASLQTALQGMRGGIEGQDESGPDIDKLFSDNKIPDWKNTDIKDWIDDGDEEAVDLNAAYNKAIMSNSPEDIEAYKELFRIELNKLQ